MENYLNQFIAWFIAGTPNLLTALVIFVLSLYLARIISNLLKRVLQRRRAPAGVVQLLGQLTLWSIIVAGTITALQQFFAGDCLPDGTWHSRFYGRLCTAGHYEELRLRSDPAAAAAIPCR